MISSYYKALTFLYDIIEFYIAAQMYIMYSLLSEYYIFAGEKGDRGETGIPGGLGIPGRPGEKGVILKDSQRSAFHHRSDSIVRIDGIVVIYTVSVSYQSSIG